MKKFNYLFILLISLFIFSCNLNSKDNNITKKNSLKDFSNYEKVSYDNFIYPPILFEEGKYLKFLNIFIEELHREEILKALSKFGQNDSRDYYYISKNKDYIIAQVANSKNHFFIVMNTDNFDIEGISNLSDFKTRDVNYYIFADSKIKNVSFGIKNLKAINMNITRDNSFISNLKQVNKNRIEEAIAFFDDDESDYYNKDSKTILENYYIIKYITTESLKFFSISNDIERILHNNEALDLSEIHSSLVNNWTNLTKELINFNPYNARKHLRILDTSVQ